MIDFAIDIAKQGAQYAYSYYKKIKNVSYKDDNTPVTIADKNTEKLIRSLISKKFPDHGIIGEELEPVNPNAKYQWIIDPIDGTRNFIKHFPYWGTLLAVLEDGKPIVGVSYFPVFDQLYSAEKGKGAYYNGKKIKLSKDKDLKEAFIVYGSIKYFITINKLAALKKLVTSTDRAYGYGWNVGQTMLFQGMAEVILEKGKLWDFAAPAIITEEAGGAWSDINGNKDLSSGTMLLTNGLLHDQVISILKG